MSNICKTVTLRTLKIKARKQLSHYPISYIASLDYSVLQ